MALGAPGRDLFCAVAGNETAPSNKGLRYIDPYLVSIVQAAEQDRQMPPVWLITVGGDLVAGTPAPAASFAQAMTAPLERMMERALKGRPRRDRKDSPGDPRALAAEALAPLRSGGPGGDDPVLTLREVRVTWSGRGDGAEVPAVRVPVNAVATWWLAGAGREVKGAASTSFGVGAFAPIGT